MRTIKTFSKTEHGHTFSSEAYTDDGKVWRWVSNNACCPLDICPEYGIPVDVEAQKKAREIDLDRELAEYRKAQKNRKPSAEELFEMRAAFGEGATVVNVITGREIKV